MLLLTIENFENYTLRNPRHYLHRSDAGTTGTVIDNIRETGTIGNNGAWMVCQTQQWPAMGLLHIAQRKVVAFLQDWLHGEGRLIFKDRDPPDLQRRHDLSAMDTRAPAWARCESTPTRTVGLHSTVGPSAVLTPTTSWHRPNRQQALTHVYNWEHLGESPTAKAITSLENNDLQPSHHEALHIYPRRVRTLPADFDGTAFSKRLLASLQNIRHADNQHHRYRVQLVDSSSVILDARATNYGMGEPSTSGPKAVAMPLLVPVNPISGPIS